MSTLKTTTLMALVLAAGLALGACSTTPEPVTEPTPTAVETTPDVDEPTPDETTEPVVEPDPVAAGTVITAEQAENLPEGQKGYPLADGTIVVVNATEPLPAPVVAAIQANLEAAFIPGKYNAGASTANNNAAAREASLATGKKVITVGLTTGLFGHETPTNEPHEIWMVSGARVNIPLDGWTKDEAIAAAQEYIAAAQNPALYELVVMAG